MVQRWDGHGADGAPSCGRSRDHFMASGIMTVEVRTDGRTDGRRAEHGVNRSLAQRLRLRCARSANLGRHGRHCCPVLSSLAGGLTDHAAWHIVARSQSSLSSYLPESRHGLSTTRAACHEDLHCLPGHTAAGHSLCVNP